MATATQKTTTTKAARKFQQATKLSQILALALADLQKAELSKDCAIYMSRWRFRRNGVCHVCLAGAVMRERFPRVGNPRATDGGVHLYDFDETLVPKFRALNYARSGFIGEALDLLGQWRGRMASEVEVADYQDDRKKFWSDMRKLLADLKKAGL